MAYHANLTGADLHEPKGVATASANTVYGADGAGSGTWTKVTTNNLDTTSIVSVLQRFAFGVIADVSAASFILIPIPVNCTITGITYVLGNAITVADSIVTATNTGVGTISTTTITQAASAEGTTFQATLANTTFTGPNYLKIATDGASTTTAPLYVTVKFNLR